MEFSYLDHRELADATQFPRLQEFVNEYYFPTWIGSGGRAAIFSPLLWNHGVIDGEEPISHPHTTNGLESWHRSLYRLGDKTNHRFWNVYNILREELGKRRLQGDRGRSRGLSLVLFR